MQWFWAIFVQVLTFYIKISDGSELHSHSSAVSQCKSRDGLLSNQDFVDGNGFISLENKQKLKSNLLDGESAWISGYVEYLSFMSWQGCYNENKVVRKIYLEQRKATFDSCFESCVPYGSMAYIGLRISYCYCLTLEDVVQAKVSIVNNSDCTQLKPYNYYYQSTNTKTISVFQIHTSLNFDPPAPALKQCVYATRVATTTLHGTSSCYSAENISGYICTNGITNKLNSTCQKFYGANSLRPAFCIQDQKTNWILANESCMTFSGQLTSEVLPTIRNEMSKGNNYWTGIFRSFKIIKKSSRVEEVETACLAVRKLNERLVFEPDDCMVPKKYLCSDWSGNKITSLSPQVNLTETVPISSKTPEDGNMKFDVIYIIVALSVVAVLAVFAGIVIKRFNRKTPHKKLQENTSASLTNNDNIENNEDENVGYSECVQPPPKNSPSKIKPKKPIRQTLRRQNVDMSYENFMLKSNDTGVSGDSTKVNEDYDRLELKSVKAKLLDKNETNESHIYDHTTAETEGEAYDTMKSAKCTQKLDFVTYNTLQKNCNEKEVSEDREKSIADAEDPQTDKENAYDTMDGSTQDHAAVQTENEVDQA